MKVDEDVNVGDKFFTDEGFEIQIHADLGGSVWQVYETRPTWNTVLRKSLSKHVITLGIRSEYYHRDKV